jgi:hypothetical protein
MIYEVKPPASEDRLAYVDSNGDMKCVTRSASVVAIPAEFRDALRRLRSDLDLALECIELWGGVPVPVTRAILRGTDQTIAALGAGLKSSAAAPGKAAR